MYIGYSEDTENIKSLEDYRDRLIINSLAQTMTIELTCKKLKISKFVVDTVIDKYNISKNDLIKMHVEYKEMKKNGNYNKYSNTA